MSKKLIVNGEELEFENEQTVPLTFQAWDIEKPNTFQSSYSINFTIPDTPRNRRILGFSNNINSDSNFPYIYQEIRLIQFGVEIIAKGQLYITAYNFEPYKLSTFEARVFSGALSMFDKVQGKSLQELDLSAYNHNRNTTTIAASVTNTYVDGYIYGLVQDGRFLDIELETAKREFTLLAPFVFVRAIVEQIISEAGFEPIFDLIDSTEFDNLLVAYTNETRPNRINLDQLNSQYDIYGGLTADVVISTNQDIKFDDFTSPFFQGIATPYNTATGVYRKSTPGGIYVKFEIQLIIDATSLTSAKELVMIADITSAPFAISFDIETINIGANTGGATSYVVEATLESQYYAGSDLLLGIRFNVRGAFSGGESFTIKQDSAIRATVFDASQEALPQLWQISPNLPDIDQFAFLKDIFLRLGIIPQDDLVTKETRLSELDYLASLGFEDWSDLLDFSKGYTLDFVIKEYGQRTVFKTENDKTVPSLNGRYELFVNDVKLPTTKEVWKSPFGANNTAEGYLQILRYKKDERFKILGLADVLLFPALIDQELKPRLCKKGEGNVDIQILDSGVRPPLDTSIPSTTVSVNLIEEINEDIAYRPNWLKSITARPKKLTINVLLSAGKIGSFKFSKPVYLKYFKALFYVNKIEQWAGNKRSTRVEFFQIGDTSVNQLPTKVLALRAEATLTNIILNWDALDTEPTSYHIERATSQAGPFAEIDNVLGNITTYTDETAISGTLYYYRVRAQNDNGFGDYSNVVSVVYVVPVPTVAPLLTLDSSNPIELSFTSVPGVDYYEVQRAVITTFAFPIYVPFETIPDGSPLEFDDATAEVGKTYYYRVRGCNASGCGPWSNQITLYVSELLVYALKFDGVNDYLNSGTYTQWERTQAFTMQFYLKDKTANGFLFDNRQNVSGQLRGISLFTNGSVLQVLLNHNNINRYVKTVVANPAALHMAVTWDGTQAILYQDGVLAADTTGVNVSDLTATIINNADFFRLFGRTDLSLGNLIPFGGIIRNFSTVNYAKSALEIASDYAAGFQSQGSGLYLLNYDFNKQPIQQSLTVTSKGGAGPSLDIVGQTAPGDWVVI